MAYFSNPPQKTLIVHAEGRPPRSHLPFPYSIVNNTALRLAGAHFEQKPSPAHGNGIFATRDIPAHGLLFACRSVAEAGEFVGLMNGTIFKPSSEIETRITTLAALNQSIRTYELVAERNRNIWINGVELRAARRIRKGEELWKNYDVEFWLVETITVSDMTTGSKQFGRIVAEWLDTSTHPLAHAKLYSEFGGLYRTWGAYWDAEGDDVMAFGKGIREYYANKNT